MAELKTKKTKASVSRFLDAVEDETKRADCFKLVEIMRQITGEEPVMWGDGMLDDIHLPTLKTMVRKSVQQKRSA